MMWFCGVYVCMCAPVAANYIVFAVFISKHYLLFNSGMRELCTDWVYFQTTYAAANGFYESLHYRKIKVQHVTASETWISSLAYPEPPMLLTESEVIKYIQRSLSATGHIPMRCGTNVDCKCVVCIQFTIPAANSIFAASNAFLVLTEIVGEFCTNGAILGCGTSHNIRTCISERA